MGICKFKENSPPRCGMVENLSLKFKFSIAFFEIFGIIDLHLSRYIVIIDIFCIVMKD